MQKSNFSFELPTELIAQAPIEDRQSSRLMHIDRSSGEIDHKFFYDIVDMLNPNDCLILNNTKVIPARLYGKKSSGARVEFLLLTRIDKTHWECICRPGKKVQPGDKFIFKENILTSEIKEVLENGNRVIEFNFTGEFFSILAQIGEMPLPHYITEKLSDAERYQTVYAKYDGSAAAPTAGLHFTNELLQKIIEKGVKIGYVTLHVGIGTFRPVKTENILEHKMHAEHYSLPPETAELIKTTKQKGGRVIAVGTTGCRTLETVASFGKIESSDGWTDIFIYPGYKFKCVDAIITNFHLPESTLIMLVSAFYNTDKIMEAYNTAVQNRYRFFSFGDAMLIT